MAARRLLPMSVILLVLMVSLVGCDRGRVGGRCRGSGWGDDGGAWILRCERGRWVRVITKGDYARLLMAARPAPAPAPPPLPAAPPTTAIAPQLPSNNSAADPSFGGGLAVVATGLELQGVWPGPAESVTVGFRDADGVGITLVRLDASGRIDASFASGGRLVAPDATSVTVDAAARPWVFGAETRRERPAYPPEPPYQDWVLTKWARRYAPTGVADASFGSGGRLNFPELRYPDDRPQPSCVARPAPIWTDVVLMYVGWEATRCSATQMDRIAGGSLFSPWGPAPIGDLAGMSPLGAAAGPDGSTVVHTGSFSLGYLLWLHPDGTFNTARGAPSTPGRTVAATPSGPIVQLPMVAVAPNPDGSVVVFWPNENRVSGLGGNWHRFLADGTRAGSAGAFGAQAMVVAPGFIATVGPFVGPCVPIGAACPTGPGVSLHGFDGSPVTVRVPGGSYFANSFGWPAPNPPTGRMAGAWVGGRLIVAHTDATNVTAVVRVQPIDLR